VNHEITVLKNLQQTEHVPACGLHLYSQQIIVGCQNSGICPKIPDRLCLQTNYVEKFLVVVSCSVMVYKFSSKKTIVLSADLPPKLAAV